MPFYRMIIHGRGTFGLGQDKHRYSQQATGFYATRWSHAPTSECAAERGMKLLRAEWTTGASASLCRGPLLLDVEEIWRIGVLDIWCAPNRGHTFYDETTEDTGPWYQMRSVAGDGTIGTTGSDGGTLLRDEEYANAARISLERDPKCSGATAAITCGIYGWMVHTRYFSDLDAATLAYDTMKCALAEIVDRIPDADQFDSDRHTEDISVATQAFIARFPT